MAFTAAFWAIEAQELAARLRPRPKPAAKHR